MNKEHSFISAVVFFGEGSSHTAFFQTLHRVLDEHFSKYEIIVVNCGAPEEDTAALKAWARDVKTPVSIIHLPLRQRLEACMNAGLDLSIGDYIYEFDSTQMPYPEECIWQAYQTALAGNDIVSVCPRKERLSSRLFYRLLHHYSHTAYPLHTNAFRLISRRALNRAHSINANLFYRKAAYASCGLKMAELFYNGAACSSIPERLELAVDSIALYTDFGYKFSLGLTFFMSLATILEMLYTIVIWLTGHPVSGWTTTMFALTFGMTGLFGILAIVLKYLSLLLRLTFYHQNYLQESVEKL